MGKGKRSLHQREKRVSATSDRLRRVKKQGMEQNQGEISIKNRETLEGLGGASPRRKFEGKTEKKGEQQG